MDRLMDGALARYGVDAVLHSASGSRAVKVFFHSISSSAWQNVDRQFCALGEVPRGRYLCVMPADADAAVEDILTVHGKNYLLRRVERMYSFTGAVYCWGICVEKGSEDQWGLNGSQQ